MKFGNTNSGRPGVGVGPLSSSAPPANSAGTDTSEEPYSPKHKVISLNNLDSLDETMIPLL